MKNTIIIIVLGVLSLASISTVVSSSGWGEREDEERYEKEYESDDHEYGSFKGAWLESRADVRPVENETLPERMWRMPLCLSARIAATT